MILRSLSRKMVAICVLSRKFLTSLVERVSSWMRWASSPLTVVSSSFTD